MTRNQICIGFAFTGSFCTFAKVMPCLQKLVSLGFKVVPILSENVYTIDTRFGAASSWREEIERITGQKAWHTIKEVEPIGPQKLLDLLIVAPCTGNTLAKLANGITDTPVTMACKAQWRNERPVLIAISTNDGLGINLRNIATMSILNHAYLVPFGQDNPKSKVNSLVANMELLIPATLAALKQKQLQPLLIQY